MIHDNHGEPAFKTRYREAGVLRGMGYEAIVIPDALAAIPGAYEKDEVARLAGPGAGKAAAPRKPGELEALIDGQVRGAVAAGMRVFFYGDALLLPEVVVRRNPGDFLCEDGSGKLCAAKEGVYAALTDQVHELFDRWPVAAGLVMRTGEVYPEATPHMVGSALLSGSCPMCREMSWQERMIKFITTMHDVVILERHKTYVHRAWQPTAGGTGGGAGGAGGTAVGNIHDDAAAYREISARIPPSPELKMSFKYTRGDFRQGQGFNPCLLVDERPKWIEFQCEREHEGKGAFPNYQGGGWRDFFEHLRRAGNLTAAEVRERFGVWGWSRGGGWGGPYVQREEWIDVNVRALAELYKVPDADPGEVATAWVGETFGVAESSPPAPAIAELLALSAVTIRRLLYVAALAAGKPGRPWVKDDVLDVEAVYMAAGRAVEAGVMTEAVAEKREALAGVDRMRQLFELAAPALPNKSQARDLSNALAYFHSFASTVVNLFIGFADHVAWGLGGRADAELARQAREQLATAQAQWQLHTQRHALLPGVPSMFHEVGLWERTNACLAELPRK